MTPQELLRLHPFFNALTAQDAQELLMRARSRRVSAGRVIFQQGEAGDGLYGILSGRVSFTVDTADGRVLILNVLGAGEFFGEIALLDGKARTATAVVRDACHLLFVARKEFMSFFGERPEALSRVIELLCARRRRSTEYNADTAFLDLSTRLAKQLVGQAHDDESPQEPALRISHAELDQGRGRLVVRDRQAPGHVIANG